MHSVMKLALSRLSGKSPGELSAGLKQLLKHYVYLQGTQGNQKKVHVHMCVRNSMMQLFPSFHVKINLQCRPSLLPASIHCVVYESRKEEEP